MSTIDNPLGKSDKDSTDSYNQLVEGDECNIFDVEPYIQADQDGLGRGADMHQWTNLVWTQVASCFHSDILSFLGAWESAVYSRNNLAADYLSRR